MTQKLCTWRRLYVEYGSTLYYKFFYERRTLNFQPRPFHDEFVCAVTNNYGVLAHPRTILMSGIVEPVLNLKVKKKKKKKNYSLIGSYFEEIAGRMYTYLRLCWFYVNQWNASARTRVLVFVIKKKKERLVSLDDYLSTRVYILFSYAYVHRCPGNSSPSLFAACALLSLMGSHLGNFLKCSSPPCWVGNRVAQEKGQSDE